MIPEKVALNMIQLTDYEILIPSELEELIPTFVERRGKELKQLEDYFSSKNFEEIARIGHRLKGHGTSYGFTALSELGEELEITAKNREYDKVDLLIKNYRTIFVQLSKDYLHK